MPCPATAAATAAVASFTAKRGAKVSDLPIQAVDRFETVINLKTAAKLGITVPPSLLGVADDVIE